MRATLRKITARTRNLTNARGEIASRTTLVLAIAHGAHVGVGEAAPLPGFSRESLEDARAALETFPWPARSPRTLEEIAALTQSIEPSARFAIECALLDLTA